MRHQDPGKRHKLLLAVQFDDRLEALLQAAQALCAASGAVLRLVHVCDPWTKSFLATAVEAGPIDLVQTLKSEAARVAERRLAQLGASLDAGTPYETAVLSGDAVKALVADAEANDCGLILVGARRGGAAGTSIGISTAVSLIMEAPCPVMVLNEQAEFVPKNTLRILVADDFTDVAAEALRVGFKMAEAWQGASFFHVHVESCADLHEACKAKGYAVDVRGAVTPEMIEFLHRKTEERMRERAGEGPGQLEARGGRYHLEVVAGGVADELERSAIAARADVAIFGSHRMFHRQTMQVGQVPFKSMLTQGRAVIVVPTRA